MALPPRSGADNDRGAPPNPRWRASELRQGESGIILAMNVDHTQLLKALKKDQGEGDIPMEEKWEIAEDVHDYVTRRMGEEEVKSEK